MMDMDDKKRYFIVASVIMEVVTPLFRTILERYYTSKGLPSLQDFLNTQPVIHILFHLWHRNANCCKNSCDKQNCNLYKKAYLPMLNVQRKLLYSEKPGNSVYDCHCHFTANPVKLEDLDITLSSLILLKCNNLLQADDAAVQGLRQYKNDYLSHNTAVRISQTEYNSLWTNLANFVVQLDPSKHDDMIRIEKRPLDEALCNSYTLHLLDIDNTINEMRTSIKGQVDGLRSDMKVQNAEMKMDMQCLRSNIQGQNVELKMYMQSLRSDIQGQNVELKMNMQGLRSDIQGQNADLKEILYTRKDGCAILLENTELQKTNQRRNETFDKEPINIKPYTLGQDIFQLHLHINLTTETPESTSGCISDMVMMDDGRLVMCLPDQKRLLICNNDGSQKDSIYLQDGPMYLTAVNKSTVAVTPYDRGCIEMYDINDKLKLGSISVPGMDWWGSGITTINNKLVVHGNNSLLIIDQQTGGVVRTLQTDCFPDRLHGSGDRIFYWVNEQYNNELHCYSRTYDKHHTIPLPSPPRSMTTLKDDSLYVKCEDGSVQHVSSDGKRYTTVTTKELKRIDFLAYNLMQGQLVTKSMDKTLFDVFCDQ